METVATLAVGLVVDMAGAFKEIDTGLGKLADKAATGGKLIAGGIAAGTAAITAFAKKSVDIAIDFESQMAILGTAASGAGVSMETLHDVALQLGADNELIGISASQAADAMTNFYKAGLTTEDIFVDLNAYMEEGASLSGAMRAAIDLQAASSLDLAAASDLVVVTMAQFGLTAEEATGITDAFVRAADASVSEVEDLAVAMEYVAPTAAAMGISMEETLAALALLSEGGKTGSSAGTALNRVLSDLTKSSDKSKKAMAELGIEIYDVEGNLKPLSEILDILNATFAEGATITQNVGGATKELTKEYAKANEKIPALTTKIGEQEQKLAILRKELGKTVEKYGEGSTQADNKRLAITKLENSITSNRDKLAEYNSTLSEYDQAVASAGTATRQLTEQEKAEYQAAIFTTQGRLALNILMQDGAGALDRMTEAMGGAATAQEVAAARTDTFAGAMESLDGTIETLMIGVGGPLRDEILKPIVQLFNDLASQYTPMVTAAFGAFAEVAKDVVKAVRVFIAGLETGQGIIESFSNALTYLLPEELAGQITDFITGASELIDKVVETATSFIEWKDVLIGVGAVVAAIVIPALWSILSPFLAIGAVIAGAVLLVAGLRTAWEEDFLGIRTAVETFGAKFAEVWNWAKERFNEFWTGLQPSLDAMYERLQKFWTEIQPSLMEAWQALQVLWLTVVDLWNTQVVPGLQMLAEALGLGGEEGLSFSTVIGVIAGVFAQVQLESILAGITMGIKVLVTAIRVAVLALRGWAVMSEQLGKVIGKVLKIVVDFTKDVVKAFEWLKKQLVGDSIIPDMMEAMLRIITESITKIVEFFRTKFTEIYNWLREIGRRILEEVRTRWNSITNAISTALTQIGSIIRTKFNEFIVEVVTKLDAIKTKVIEKMDAIKAWFAAKWDQIKTTFTTKLAEALAIVTGALDDIKQALIDLDLTEAAKGIIDTIKKGFNDKVGEAKGVISGLISDIEGIVSGANLYQKGVDMINSLKDGILAQLNAILGEIQQKIADFWESVTNLLGDGDEAVPEAPTETTAQSFGQAFASTVMDSFSRQANPMVSSITGGTSYVFTMEVHTNAPVSTVMSDFDLMKAMAGAG